MDETLYATSNVRVIGRSEQIHVGIYDARDVYLYLNLYRCELIRMKKRRALVCNV